MAQRKSHVKVGDQVLVLSGKDKGKKGEVLQIFLEKERAIVEGVNFITKHMRPDPQTQQGGAVQIEGAVHLSNLKLVCPRTDKPIRTKRRVVEKEIDGRTRLFRERISVVDNESIERT
ncbi:uncharacterized protein METZ01_LOCUS119466 [marine metagenome]|uniref:KOW domain-containing protein n=1 Tax=marine metagenome TaxID=408172 RepID=A0A381XQ44_9ZZZZ|tara:strand:+ start:1987 stop:2340 length:354 start_codon:yes stop_codon:yes gene_type:complete